MLMHARHFDESEKRATPHLLHVKVTMRDLRGIESWMLLSSLVLSCSLPAPDAVLPDGYKTTYIQVQAMTDGSEGYNRLRMRVTVIYCHTVKAFCVAPAAKDQKLCNALG